MLPSDRHFRQPEGADIGQGCREELSKENGWDRGREGRFGGGRGRGRLYEKECIVFAVPVPAEASVGSWSMELLPSDQTHPVLVLQEHLSLRH